MSNLHIIPFAQTTEERIHARIDAFRKDFISQDGDLELANKLISLVVEYLQEFDDELHLDQAYLKLNESIFYLDKYMYG
jgi:hypothetical protein